MARVILQNQVPPSSDLKEVGENFPVSKLPKNYFKEHVGNDGKNSSGFFHNLKFKQIPVSQTAFYDLGFDPDFSCDGNIFYKERPVFRFLLLLIKMIRSVIKYPGSFLQAPEEKAFRELVQIEKNWQKAAQANGMLYPVDDTNLNKAFWQVKAPYICELKEHQFFKQLSKITNINEPNKNIYPSELLKPLHRFNRPQKPSCQSKEAILNKGIENSDVARLDAWGFTLLGNHNKNYFIDHKSFLYSVDVAGDKLKHAIRELRVALRKGNYEGFNEKLHKFEKQWNEYITSHELLKDLALIYSQKDFFEAKHQALEEVYQEMQNANAYYNENFLEDLNTKIIEINDHKECSDQLYKTFLSNLPDSLTAKKILEIQKSKS